MLADCRCPECETLYEDKILFNDEKFVCPDCNVECETLPSISAHFRLKYDNKKDICAWGGESYSTSQYYSQQKKMCKGNIFPMPQKTKGGKKTSVK